MNKLLAFAAAMLLAISAHAQSGASANQAANASAANAATNAGVTTTTTLNTYGTPNTTANNTLETKGHSKVDTTPSVFSPGLTTSSGGYNCNGSKSGGIGVTGAGANYGTTVEMTKCPRFYMMDKARERALNSKGEVADPRFVKVWDALYCMDEEGALAYSLAGMTCPQDEAAKNRAQAVQTMGQPVTDAMTGRPVVAGR